MKHKSHSFRYIEKRIALFEMAAENVCVECLADCGAADEGKLALFLSKSKCLC
jgi:hypothetical protein